MTGPKSLSSSLLPSLLFVWCRTLPALLIQDLQARIDERVSFCKDSVQIKFTAFNLSLNNCLWNRTKSKLLLNKLWDVSRIHWNPDDLRIIYLEEDVLLMTSIFVRTCEIHLLGQKEEERNLILASDWSKWSEYWPLIGQNTAAASLSRAAVTLQLPALRPSQHFRGEKVHWGKRRTRSCCYNRLMSYFLHNDKLKSILFIQDVLHIMEITWQ